MYSHTTDGYDCPFCRVIGGRDLEGNLVKQSDIFYQDDYTLAFIALKWRPNNLGHALIIPKQHVENLYELPHELGGHLLAAARKIAIAFKEVYQCEGISTRQHNEPVGGQNIFHYHMHIFPRFKNDYLYELSNNRISTTPKERLVYAEKLRQYFAEN